MFSLCPHQNTFRNFTSITVRQVQHRTGLIRLLNLVLAIALREIVIDYRSNLKLRTQGPKDNVAHWAAVFVSCRVYVLCSATPTPTICQNKWTDSVGLVNLWWIFNKAVYWRRACSTLKITIDWRLCLVIMVIYWVFQYTKILQQVVTFCSVWKSALNHNRYLVFCYYSTLENCVTTK